MTSKTQIIARFQSDILPGANKLNPDKTKLDGGYHKQVLGGFNIANEAGIFYKMTPAIEHLYKENGTIGRLLRKSICKGESGHPDITGLSEEEAIFRMRRVDERMEALHIRAIELHKTVDEHRNQVILAIGEVKGTGPYGPSFQASLENPHEDTYLSIRSFALESVYGGKIVRTVKDVITYDAVTEGGISKASKYVTMSMEKYACGFYFTEQHMDNVIKKAKTIGIEEMTIDLVQVKTNLGWVKTDVIGRSILHW